MITPVRLLPIFMGVLLLSSSHILMEIPPYSYLWQQPDYLKDTGCRFLRKFTYTFILRSCFLALVSFKELLTVIKLPGESF